MEPDMRTGMGQLGMSAILALNVHHGTHTHLSRDTDTDMKTIILIPSYTW